jgi:hypothetical protein
MGTACGGRDPSLLKRGQTMQQFARIRVGEVVVPVILSGDAHLDLRPIAADITPQTIASGALARVDTTKLSPITGKFTYLAPIAAVQQIPATGFNYKKHIEELHVAMPTEPELFLKATSSLTGPFDPIRRGWTSPLPNLRITSSVTCASMTFRIARRRLILPRHTTWSAQNRAPLMPRSVRGPSQTIKSHRDSRWTKKPLTDSC